jgi:type III pantothenate kinase
MVLILDVGNTNLKTAVFEGFSILHKKVVAQEMALPVLEEIFIKFPQISKVVMAASGKLQPKLYEFLQKHSQIFEITHHSKVPFGNLYKTPLTLGLDRLALVAGSSIRYPKQNVLVIDAGTCITYDFLNKDNQYLGGAISPGIHLRFKALHLHTAKLPLLEKESNNLLIGNTTNTAIQSGVVNGVLLEIDGFISKYSVKNEDLTIILTGGDTNFLSNQLKSTIFANENFLLESLYQLYIYNHTQ